MEGCISIFNSLTSSNLSQFSDCNIVNADLNIKVDVSELPVQHGADVQYTCAQNSDILDGNVKAVCKGGKISLSPENVSPCKEPSM